MQAESLAAQVGKLTEKGAHLTIERDALAANTIKLTSEVARLSKEGAANKALASKLSAEKEALQEKHAALSASAAHVAKEKEKLQGVKQALTATAEKLTSDLSDLAAKNKTMAEEIGAMRLQLSEAEQAAAQVSFHHKPQTPNARSRVPFTWFFTVFQRKTPPLAGGARLQRRASPRSVGAAEAGPTLEPKP